MTTLHITVGDRDHFREKAFQFVRDAGAENDDRPVDADRAVLQFGSYDDLVESLTPLRLELLQAIATGSTGSMREVARLVDRDVSDVHGELRRLEVLGVIELEPGGPNGAIRPVVPFERIEMHMDYRLVGDEDATPASA